MMPSHDPAPTPYPTHRRAHAHRLRRLGILCPGDGGDHHIDPREQSANADSLQVF